MTSRCISLTRLGATHRHGFHALEVGIPRHDALLGPQPAKLVGLVTALVRSHCCMRQEWDLVTSAFVSISFPISLPKLTLVEQSLRALAGRLAIAKVEANHLVVCRERVFGTLGRELFMLQLGLVRVVRHGSHGCNSLLPPMQESVGGLVSQ